MKVLQVVHQFVPEYVGGTEVYVDNISRELVRRGHQVRILAGGDGRAERDWHGARLDIVPGGVRGKRGAVRNFLTAFGNPGVEKAFSTLCEEFRPDVVHFHHLLGLSSKLISIARSLGVTTVFTLHDYWFLCPNGQLITERQKPCGGPVLGLNCGVCAAYRLGAPPLLLLSPLMAPIFIKRQALLRDAVSLADVVIAPSRFIGAMAEGRGIPKHKIVYVNHGIETAPAQQSRAQDGRLHLVYLGSIAPVKGVHVLVEAVKRLESGKVGLRIYGDLSVFPAYAKQLEMAAKGSEITFEGPLARSDVPRALGEADLLVVPSLWYENAPLVVQEAFAAGVPVVASRIGALEEWVADGVSGLNFRTGDPEDLAGKLRRLMDSPDLLDRLRASIPKVLSIYQHVDEIERVYNKVICKDHKH